MRKVDLLKEEQPKLAYRFLTQATRLYHDGISYSKNIDKKFNEIFKEFIIMYPPQVKPNSALINH